MRRILLLTLPLLATAASAQRVGQADYRSPGATRAADDARAAELKRIEASPWRVQPVKQPDFAVNASTTAPRVEARVAPGPQLRRSAGAGDASWSALRTPLPQVDTPAPARAATPAPKPDPKR